MRRGIALLVTLFLIITLSALIMSNQQLTTEAFERSEEVRFLVQTNVAFEDTLKILNTLTQQITDHELYSFLLSLPPLTLNDQESGMQLSLSCLDESGRLDLNALFVNQKPQQHYVELLEELLIQYQVLDPAFFIALVLDAMDSDSEERMVGSERLELGEGMREQGEIVSYSQWESLVRDYEVARNDPRIGAIPWRELITPHSGAVDFNRAPPQLLALMHPDLFIRQEIHEQFYSDYEELEFFLQEDVNRSKSFGVEFYAPRMRCDFSFTQFGYTSRIDFLYDMKQQRVLDIEYLL